MPLWFWIVAIFGLVWNAFGVIEFITSFMGTVESLMRHGLTAAQATLYTNLPAWMHITFALGVFGGAIGCVLLLFRSRYATLVFLMSLLASITLFMGDLSQGVFEAFGSFQIGVLFAVVFIAAALLCMSRYFEKTGKLK